MSGSAIGIVGGLAAALLWGSSAVAAARSSRIAGAASSLAWVYVVGFALVAPIAVATGAPGGGAATAAWVALADATAVVSLYLMYVALRSGPALLVMPLTASSGAVAAVLAVLAGETLEPPAGAGLAIVLVGMVAVMRRGASVAERAAHPSRALVLAAASALTAGISLYAAARGAEEVGTPWLIASLRTAGVVGVTLPLLAAGRLRLPRRATPLVVFSGVADTAAFGSYVYATGQAGVAVPAVLSSQYAAVSAVLAVLVLGERLSRPQVAGVAAILAGVTLVAAVRG